jgi:hypothetical protein
MNQTNVETNVKQTTLLALHIMAFHPNPHENMLLPVMDQNIAQISRAWIAASLVTGLPNHDSLSNATPPSCKVIHMIYCHGGEYTIT